MNAIKVLLIGYIVTGVTWGQSAVDVDPAQQVRREGDEFRFVCRVGHAVDTCRIELPTHNFYIFKNDSKSTDPQVYDYFGNGLQVGDCGLLLHKIDLTHHGVFKCIMSFPHSITQTHGQTQLIVAKPPQSHEMTPIGKELKTGDKLNATCTVKNSRPAAKISWFIDDEPITQGVSKSEMIVENMRQPDVFSTSRNLSRTLKWQDHGKKLRCVTQHVSYDRERSIDKVLQVKFAPQPHQLQLEQSGLEKNKEGWITVVVAAFPQPELHWRADELNITDESEQYETHPAQKIVHDPGRWEAILRIKNISDADFDKIFILTATNELGSENYVVRISGFSHNATMIALIAGFASFLLVIIIASIILCCRYKPASKPRARKLENDGYLTPRPSVPAAEPVYDVLKYDDDKEEDDNHMYEYVTAPRPRPDAPLIQHFNDPVPLYRDVPLPPSGPIPFIDAPNLPSEREEYEDVPTPQPHAMANGLKPIQFRFPSPENQRSYENVSTSTVV